ncbi:hypothetical protein [Deinococcus sp. QL22]|uniref:hypothetical protein n=1 Tax=Deinococcus sp. QL22 TaxID=2939437 RepID=UPI002017E68F|nr:hypothetical protein [Deinococcus sp. QL22]UQN07997.1 hypothetical protein M1R55_18050 [Deinococcus sp. QL22]
MRESIRSSFATAAEGWNTLPGLVDIATGGVVAASLGCRRIGDVPFSIQRLLKRYQATVYQAYGWEN